MSLDEQIEAKVNEVVDRRIKELKLQFQHDKKPELVLPCRISEFKKHFSRGGRPLPHSTFSAWRKRGWVSVSGRLVVELNKHFK